MLSNYLERGAVAGVAGGLVYGLFVWLVGTPLVRTAERYEQHAAGGQGQASAPAVPDAVAAATSIIGGVLFGVLLGVVVFGLAYYFLEPSIPGESDTRCYLLGAAGFVTVSGAPWVALPPRPPGVEAALPTDLRLGIYVGMMALGAFACALVLAAYTAYGNENRVTAFGLGVAAVAVVPVVGVLVPTGVVGSPVPETLASSFRWTTVFGQVMLWAVLSSSHAWLVRRHGGPAAAEPHLDDAPVAAD